MFITEIVHCPYSYYAYTDIADIEEKEFDENVFHDAKLLHRVAARFSILRAVVSDRENGMIKKALQLADSRMKLTPSIEKGNRQMVYVSELDEQLMETLPVLIESDLIFIFFRGLEKNEAMKNFFEIMAERLKHGVALRDSDFGIVVVNKKMPAMKFDVRL